MLQHMPGACQLVAEQCTILRTAATQVTLQIADLQKAA